ncbi:MAG: Hsp20 family protein [Hyphomicrobiales bacterium]|nr:Hsp20 family protein [Hyphomicrobiales bacterium]
MRTIDFSPLFRHSVGFERMQRMLDAVSRMDDASASYPPYNIEVTGADSYRITMAVAGFAEDDLELVVKEDTLTVTGKAKQPEGEVNYLHRGIAGRAFTRRFQLADHIKVVGADLVNGLLHVDLAREVPEELKPRKVAIGAAPKTKSIEQKAA